MPRDSLYIRRDSQKRSRPRRNRRRPTRDSSPRPRRQRSPRRRRSPIGSGVYIGLLLTALVGINIYVFFFRGETSIRDLLEASSVSGGALSLPPPVKKASAGARGTNAVSKAGGTPAAAAAPLPPPPGTVYVKGSMEGHIGLSTALEAAGIAEKTAAGLIEALQGHLNMRKLLPSQRFEAELDRVSGTLVRFTFHLSAVRRLVVTRDDQGRYRVQRKEDTLQSRVVDIGGIVDSSLHQAISRAGESSVLVARLVDLFSWDINWYSDPREGDAFRVVVEKQYHRGRFYRYGRVLAAEYVNRGKRYQAFYYERRNGRGGYFTPEGRSIRRTYLKTPLEYSRISSRFNRRRFHPILHRIRGHYGVDYAAAQGTPVKAAANGRVARRAWSGGAGNMVVLQHPGRVRTVYMHLHHFAPGLRAGQRVDQGHVIGYVGATGLATGPHLHYGIYVKGRPVDPLHFDVSPGEMLPRTERRRFLASVSQHRERLQQVMLASAQTVSDGQTSNN